MTIASTRDTKLTADAMVLLAHKRAGLMDASADGLEANSQAKMAFGRVLLDTIVDELGGWRPARLVVFETLQLVVGQQDYELSESIVDVVGDGKYIAAEYAATPDLAQGETVVRQVNLETWHSLGDKGSTGLPTMFYADRGGDDYKITVRVHYRPEEAGVIRFAVHKAPADSTAAAATLDMQSSFNQYILHQLAGQLLDSANGPPERVRMLLSMANDMKMRALESGANQAPIPVEVMLRPAQCR